MTLRAFKSERKFLTGSFEAANYPNSIRNDGIRGREFQILPVTKHQRPHKCEFAIHS